MTTEGKTVVTLTIPEELAVRLQHAADEHGCTLEELIIHILEEWLAQQEIPLEPDESE